jgi:hypothetical protein
MPKFMQSLGEETYQRLATEAKARDVIVPDWLKTIPAAPTLQTAFAKPIIQPTSPLLTHTGITETTRRPFLSTAIGRGRP